MEKYLQMLINFNELLVEHINIGIPMFAKYYMIFKIEIIIILFFADLLLLGLWDLNFNWYYKIKFKLVERPSRLIRAYKLFNGIHNLISFIRPRYIRNNTNEEKGLIDYIYEDSFFKYIKRIIIYFFSPKYISNLIALATTTLLYYDIELSSLISRYFQLLTKNNLLSFLTVLPAIIIVLIVIIGWKYTSLKGRYIRGANRLNQKIIEETLDIHRRLVEPLITVIDKASKNIEYALNCKDLLIESRLRKMSPFIRDIENDKVIWDEKYIGYEYDYEFDDIEEIGEIANIIREAKEKNIYEEFFWIRHYSDVMIGIDNLKRESEKLEDNLRFYLFTTKTLRKILKEDKEEVIYSEIQEGIPNEDKKGYFERKILKDIKEFKIKIDRIIIKSIEMLVDLGNYNKGIYSLLHFNSNRLGRTLSYWTDRE
ncbi:MAG: hypothetical protein MJA82_19130 [Clostridia bacterium]|nr:hypothetical protein [Clostridia bacterium]